MATLDPPLLLVGLRRGVLPALARLKRSAYALVVDAPIPSWADGLAGIRAVDLHGREQELERAARELLDGANPGAVVALGERTVLAAARLREAFGLPGNGYRTALACADKVEMKRAIEGAGLPVAKWREVGETTTSAELVRALSLPIVLKPRRDSGGRGQVLVRDEERLDAELEGLAGTRGMGAGWLAEGWIEGVEMSVESFVHAGEVLFSNPTEYLVKRHANILPAQLDETEWEAIRGFVAEALRAVGVERGITHLELFRTAAGLVFGELAIRPPGGRLMPLLRRAWGFDPWEALLRLELGERPAFPERPRCTSGAWVLHPGPGRVLSIAGLEEARRLPGVTRIDVKARAGDVLEPRQGSGQDIGTIRAEGPNRTRVAEALQGSRALLRFELG